MKWSWKIGEFAGIGVYVHATFLLIIAYVVFLHVERGDTAAGVAKGVLFVLAIFGCVVLHEFGHALAAKRYGIKTRDITLLPIGGVARLERMPDDPKQELVVALAGPAVNVVIAAVLFVGLKLAARLDAYFSMDFISGSFAENLMNVNIWLVIFNLIPAFPMDGGRVLRALLATRMDYVQATNIAASVGQALAFLFVIEGLFGVVGFGPNPFLLFIALFVYMGAAQEAGMVQVKSALGGIPVQRAMLTQFREVGPNDPLQRAVDLTLAGTQKDFPVVDAERKIVGLLCQDDLLRGLQRGGQNGPVSSAMKTEYQTCHPGEMLERVFMRLQEGGVHTVPVTRDGELVGLLTMENVGEMLRIQAALDERKNQMGAAVRGCELITHVIEMLNLAEIQDSLQQSSLNGWLLYDFRGGNPLARRVLRFPEGAHATRRWFYFIPAQGEPRKLVHRIESGVLDHLPGEKRIYLRWEELEAGVHWLLDTVGGTGEPLRVAMEYAPGVSNPYVSYVDAGTIEFVRSLGVTVASSGDLIQQFEAALDDEQWAMHLGAARSTDAAYSVAWKFIAEGVRAGRVVTELDVRGVIMDYFRDNDLVTDHGPIVGVGPHSGDPHYDPTEETSSRIEEGSFVLIDLWAKLNRPRSIYSDLTRVGFVGLAVPEQYSAIFRIVAAARDAGIAAVRGAYASGRPIRGYEVDDACRSVIVEAGYGEYFVHRTGHNIGENTHGNGAHMDNLETREERLVSRRTLFSIEPGIYLPEFGVRSEVNVFVDASGAVHVTGGELQQEVFPVLSQY